MNVRDCHKTVTPDVDLVGLDSSIDDIIDIISKNPASRSVFVVDTKEKLVGIISVKEVLQILGAKYLQKRSVTVVHEILATTASDIMRDPEFVSPEDDLETALKTAVIQNLEDLPVVKNGKVIGNLDCFELIKGIREGHRIARNGNSGS